MPTCVITGASSGIGAELARQLAAQGWDLALAARRTERLEELRAEIAGRWPDSHVELATVDVTDAAAVSAAFEGFVETFGHLDRVIVNAGLGGGDRIGTGRTERNLAVTRTNVLGALAQLEAALAILRRQADGHGKGHLVVMSSFATVRGMPGSTAAYGASKAWLSHIADGLRTEFAGTQIRVTTLLPGYVASELTDATRPPKILTASTAQAVEEMVTAMNARRETAWVPRVPWGPLSWLFPRLPRRLARHFI